MHLFVHCVQKLDAVIWSGAGMQSAKSDCSSRLAVHQNESSSKCVLASSCLGPQVQSQAAPRSPTSASCNEVHHGDF